jgi:hypothetical protein
MLSIVLVMRFVLMDYQLEKDSGAKLMMASEVVLRGVVLEN